MFIQLLSSTSIDVHECGCLGECGNGPNIQMLDRRKVSKHVESIDDILLLLEKCHLTPTDQTIRVVRSKLHADSLLVDHKEPAQAAQIYASLIDSSTLLAGVFRVSILCNFSKALLQAGELGLALRTANQAVDEETTRVNAWKRKAEAHEMLDDYDSAIQAWIVWGKLHNSREYQYEAQNIIRKLEKKRKRKQRWKLWSL